MIPQMRRLGVADELLVPVETELARIFDNLERQVSLVDARNRLSAMNGDTAVRAVDEAQFSVETLKPNMVDATTRLLARSDGVRDILLQPGADPGSALEAFEVLTDAGFFEVSRLTEMRFSAESIVSQVEAVLLMVSVDRIGSTEETKEHMGLLKGRIERTETLMEDLLEFSRVGRKVTEQRTVDLSLAIPETFKLVVPPDRFSLETVGVLPLLVTAAAPLEQVFRNLIGNSDPEISRGTTFRFTWPKRWRWDPEIAEAA